MLVTQKTLNELQNLKQKLEFTYLPSYARFILENHMPEFAVATVKLAEEMELPMLRFFKDDQNEQVIDRFTLSSKIMLEQISRNRTFEYMNKAVKIWLNNQSSLAREQVVVKDLILGFFTRRRIFGKYLSRYTNDIDLAMAIMGEVDIFSSQEEYICTKAIFDIQENLYKETESITNMGNWIWDLKTGLISASEEIYRIYELPTETQLKFGETDLTNFIHKDDVAPIRKYLENFIHTLEPLDFYFRIVLNGGTTKIVHSKGRFVTNEEGEPLKMHGTLQDVTRQKMNEIELTQINAELKTNERKRKIAEDKLKEYAKNLRSANNNLTRSNQELQQFAYAASHDLQEPLRKIIIFSGKLQQEFNDALSAEGKEYITKMVSSAQRMTRLIDDLLNFSRVSRSEDQLTQVDLTEILKNVLNDFEIQIAQKNAVISYDNLPAIPAISLQMTQLFQNIISNALKFTVHPTSPMVSIRHTKPDLSELEKHPHLNPQLDYCKIIFKDNGIGFNPVYADQIFTIFQRLHGKSEFSGTGIGLALCRKITDNHHGTIYAVSEDNKGAEFHVILPTQQSAGIA